MAEKPVDRPPASVPSRREAPRLVIAILTWRGYDAAKACLQGLRSLTGMPIETLVVDNASGTGEAERLAADGGSTVSALLALSTTVCPVGTTPGSPGRPE